MKSLVWLMLAMPLLLATPHAAHAGAKHESAEETARQEVRRGLALFGKGEARAALLEFQSASVHAPGANGPHRYAAECYAVLEEWDAALAEYEKYLAIDPTVSDADKVRARMDAIRKRQLGQLVVSADAPGSVVVDQQAEVATTLGATGAHEATFDLPPGAHSIVFRPKEGNLAEQTRPVTLASGKPSSVHFQVPRPVVVAPPVLEQRDVHPLRPLGMGLAIGGVTVLATSLVLDATWVRGSLENYDAATRSVTNYRTDGSPTSAIANAQNAATRSQNIVLAGYIVGSAVALGGVAIYALGPTKRVTVGASFNGISVGGTF